MNGSFRLFGQSVFDTEADSSLFFGEKFPIHAEYFRRDFLSSCVESYEVNKV